MRLRLIPLEPASRPRGLEEFGRMHNTTCQVRPRAESPICEIQSPPALSFTSTATNRYTLPVSISVRGVSFQLAIAPCESQGESLRHGLI